MQKIGVYILLCSNGRYYIGSTQDIERRLFEHEAGRVTSTKHLRPVQLAHFQPYATAKEARQIEYKIKQQKSRGLIERILNEKTVRL